VTFCNVDFAIEFYLLILRVDEYGTCSLRKYTSIITARRHASEHSSRVCMAWILFSPHGMHVPRSIRSACVNFFLFKNKHLSKMISASTGPIFTKLSPYGRYLIPIFRWIKGHCHCKQLYGQNRKNRTIHLYS